MTEWHKYFEVKTGDVVVDLGAYIGETTHYYSQKVGSSGVVIALEPDAVNFGFLYNLVIKKNITNTYVLMMGIAKETGKTYLNIGGANAHSTILSGRRFYGKRVVPVISWDDLVESLTLPKVDICKINVEGAELECFEGMTKTFPDKILVDVHHRFGVDVNYFKQLITDRGYRILDCKSSAPNEGIVNNLFYAVREN